MRDYALFIVLFCQFLSISVKNCHDFPAASVSGGTSAHQNHHIINVNSESWPIYRNTKRVKMINGHRHTNYKIDFMNSKRIRPIYFFRQRLFALLPYSTFAYTNFSPPGRRKFYVLCAIQTHIAGPENPSKIFLEIRNKSIYPLSHHCEEERA